MPVYTTNSEQQQCGYVAGILCMDEYLPFPPGTVNNASTFDYPVLYKLVPGWRSNDVIAGNEENFLPAMVDKAKELERAGVRFIAGNCGYAIRVQQEIANAVSIPVAMSPLLQIPIIASSLGRHQSIGVMCAAAPPLSPEFIAGSGIEVDNTIVVYGLQDEPGFKKLLGACVASKEDDTLVEYDTDDIRADMIRVAGRMQEDNPQLGAIVSECSEFPPYSKAVQDATGLPVFDFVTMIDLLHSSTLPSSPTGFI